MMKRYSLTFCTWLVICLSIAGVVHAQTEVSLTLTSAGSNAPYGVYVGPYTLQVNGGGTISSYLRRLLSRHLNKTRIGRPTLMPGHGAM